MKTRTTRTAAALIALALVAAACGDDDDSSNDTTAATEAPSWSRAGDKNDYYNRIKQIEWTLQIRWLSSPGLRAALDRSMHATSHASAPASPSTTSGTAPKPLRSSSRKASSKIAKMTAFGSVSMSILGAWVCVARGSMYRSAFLATRSISAIVRARTRQGD